MPYVPTKRCTNYDKHDPHPWNEGPFKRDCPGRTTKRLRTKASRDKRRRREQ